MSERRVVAVLVGAAVALVGAEWCVRGEPGAGMRALRFAYPFVIAIGAALIMHRAPAPALTAIGLRRPVLPGLLVGLVGALPMAAVLAWSAGGVPAGAFADPLGLLESSFGAGLREELVFRGLFFLSLWRFTRVGFRGAMVISALLFAAGHLPGHYAAHGADGLLGVLVITGAGGAFYAWLVAVWDSLWVAVALHAGMNLAWSVFAAAPDAVGGQDGNLARLATIAFMVVLTERHRRAHSPG